MGLFKSSCKKCNNYISYFILDADGLTCKKCGEFNTKKDLWDNEFWGRNKDLKLMMDRVNKINKIKRNINDQN